MTETEPLSAAESHDLVEFARACKAAARVVSLYQGGHPSIAATLGRIAQLTSTAHLAQPLRLTVLGDAILLDGRPLSRTDTAVSELAALLHTHLIGALTVHPGGDPEAWRSFLLLLARTPEAVRADGGIARVWTTMAGRHLEIQEIDYARVLREGSGVGSAEWQKLIAACLNGSAIELNEAFVRSLLDAASSDRKSTRLNSSHRT